MASRAITLDVRLARYFQGLRQADAPWLDGCLMLIAAFLIRSWWFGDPVVQVDEQFYLLVGDRLLHGALPFVDIWDRKPIGLFLAYAAIRMLGGGGIVEYQLVATLLAATTALLVVRSARLFASAAAARAMGVAMLMWLVVFDGAGGQAPIFYGPLVAAAGLMTMRAVVDRRGGGRSLWLTGVVAMICMGIAIQIKYTAMFEGMGFGLALLWEGHRRSVAPLRLLAMAAGWIAIALAPTLLAFAVYAWLGHAEAFAYANFISIGDRAASGVLRLLKRLIKIAGCASPLLAMAALGLSGTLPDARAERARRFMLLWTASAIIGLLAIGAFYTHYFLPVLTPLAIAGAAGLDRLRAWRTNGRTWGIALLIAIGGVAAYLTGVHRWHARGDDKQIDALVDAIKPHLTDSLYVFDGEPVLYYLTNAPIATRYAFPSHLNKSKEATAIGVDPRLELARIIARRPSVIVTSNRPLRDPNVANWTAMNRALRLFYRPVTAVRVSHRIRIVWARIGPAPMAAS